MNILFVFGSPNSKFNFDVKIKKTKDSSNYAENPILKGHQQTSQEVYNKIRLKKVLKVEGPIVIPTKKIRTPIFGLKFQKRNKQSKRNPKKTGRIQKISSKASPTSKKKKLWLSRRILGRQNPKTKIMFSIIFKSKKLTPKKFVFFCFLTEIIF